MTRSGSSGQHHRGRRWPRRLAALLIGFLIAGLGAEFAVRASGLRVARRGGRTDRLLARVPDPAVGFRLVPGTPAQRYRNADGSETLVRYSINPDGFRGPRVPEQKPPNTLRIAVLGDSFVFGTGVEDEATLPRTLERWFEQHPLPGRRIEVLNFGVPGYGIEQQPPRLQRDALRYDPDLVLLVLYVNDAVATDRGDTDRGEKRRNIEPALRTPELEWIDRLGLTSNLPEDTSTLPAAQRRMIALRRRSRLLDLLGDRLFLTLFGEHTRTIHEHAWREDGPGWGRVREVLWSLKRRGEREGFGLQVAFYPLLDELDEYPYREIHARVATFCAEQAVPFHDLLVPLDGVEASALWAHAHDHHPNAHCNDVVGRWMAERMSAGLADL